LLGAAHQFHRIQLQQKTRGAPLGRGAGVEDVRLSERQVCRMQIRRILVQKKSQICGLVGRICNIYEHEVYPSE
jgi:hypothetical protein